MAEPPNANDRRTSHENIEAWNRRRTLDVQGRNTDAHSAGQKAWAELNRQGIYVVAARPSDVAALGLRALAHDARNRAQPASQLDEQLSNVAEAAGAVANGAQDAFTFGLGNRAYAGVRAIDDALHGDSLQRSYIRHLAGTRAQAAYDETHHPISRLAGEAAGTAAQIALIGAGEGVIAAGKGLSQARRIKQASGLIAREAAVLTGGGAAAGAGGQALDDIAHRRAGSTGDYIAASLGGAAGVGSTILSRGRASLGGGVDGAVTSLGRDILNGRSPSLDRARAAAAAGALFGGAAGAAGRKWSRDLSRKETGDFGERLSEIRTLSRGDKPLPGPKVALKLDAGGRTIPDHLTEAGEIVEAKFGNNAGLSRRQLQAYMQPLLKYRVDHFLPRDVGALAGTSAAQFGRGLFAPRGDATRD